MTNLLSTGWGVLLDLSELQALLVKISSSERSWTASVNDEPNQSPRVNILYTDRRSGVSLTSDGLAFPVFIDTFPWLTFEPLIALHPSLCTAIRKHGVQQIDPCADFDVMWSPVRDALTVESLRAAANCFEAFAHVRRSGDGR